MSIMHIEDLPIDEFINAVRSLNDFNITEKVDGFNIRFGIDEKGFYTTGKDDNRKYNVSAYGKEFRYTGFKSAHKALARVLPELVKHDYLIEGDEIEAEVLFGHLPNTVPYDGEENKLILLRKKKGAPDLNKIKETLDGRKITVTVEAPSTNDGKTIQNEKQTHIWVFSKTPRVSPVMVTKIKDDLEFDRSINELEKFLHMDSGIADFSNAELISLPLNKRPNDVDAESWKNLKALIKEKRDDIRSYVLNHKLEIKSKLLDTMVREISSEFGPDIEEGGWIEGLVFHNEDMQFKLVDKDVFTALNEFNWKVRRQLTGSTNSVNQVESIVSKIKVAMAKKLGHPELGTSQKNRYVKNNNITSKSLANDINDFYKLRDEFIEIIDKGTKLLDSYHTLYQKYKTFSKKEVNFGKFKRIYQIDKKLDEKNLEAFAELYDLLISLEQRVASAKSAKDLVEIVLNPKVDVKESIKSML